MNPYDAVQERSEGAGDKQPMLFECTYHERCYASAKPHYGEKSTRNSDRFRRSMMPAHGLSMPNDPSHAALSVRRVGAQTATRSLDTNVTSDALRKELAPNAAIDWPRSSRSL